MKNSTLRISYLLAVLLLPLFSSAQTTWYRDADGDGYGNVSVTQVAVSQPTGYVRNNIDGDDAVTNHTAWGRLGKNAFSATAPVNDNIEIAVGPTGTAYMVFLDANSSKPTAMKKAEGDSVWTVIDTPGLTTRDLVSPSGTVTFCNIAVDSKDTVWVAVNKASRLEMYRWHASANNGKWSRIARLSTALSSGTYRNLDLAIGANDTPFISTIYSSNRVRGIYLNPATRSFDAAAASDDVYGSANAGDHVSIALSSSGNPCISLRRTQSSDNNIYVAKRVNNAWSILGATSASEGDAEYGQVAVDASGNPYLFFADYSNSRNGKGTVRRYNGSSWVTVGTGGFTTGAISKCAIAIDQSTNDVYIAYADQGDNDKLIVRKYNGSGGWAALFDSSLTTNASSVALAIRNGILYLTYKDGNNSSLASALRYGPDRIWRATQSTAWADARNWCGNDAPADGEAVTFKASTTYEPTAPTGTSNFRLFTIQSSDTLNIASGNTFAVNGDFVVNGTVTGDGLIQLNSTLGSQSISGTGTVSNLELNNSFGATIQASSTLSITGTYTPSSGLLTTNGGLVLKSGASGTARIAAGTGTYLSGGATVERYIPGGRRAMRYFSHPFTSALTLSQLTGAGEIDITGAGGSSNGFTGTSTNAPSASWYDPTTGNESTISDPGWTYFTSPAGGGANNWNQYQAIKVLVRGKKGEGLANTNYTPSAVTVNMTGAALNQGDQVVTLTKGTISGYNLIGNPFPSQVDLSLTTRGVNIESNFWVWNPNGGTKGIYEANPFALSYVLPAYSGFFARTVNNTNNTITFSESCKSSGTPSSLFKTTAGQQEYYNILNIEDSTGKLWDKFILLVDSAGIAAKDRGDAVKFFNSEMNFYSFSAAGDSLAVDSRIYVDSQVIPVDMWNGVKGKFVINVSKLDMPAGTDLYLEDSFTHTTVKLLPGYKYPFTTTTNPLSEHHRFALRFSGVPLVDTSSGVDTIDTTDTTVTDTVKVKKPKKLKKLKAMVYPNPIAHGISRMLIKTSDADDDVICRIYTHMGKKIMERTYRHINAELFEIPVDELNPGLYIIQIESGGDVVTKHFQKR